MSAAVHVFELLESQVSSSLPAIVVIYGSDAFLRRQALSALLSQSSVDLDAVQSYDGDDCDWRDVHDELATQSLFDTNHNRIAIVKSADKFITKHRASLERWTEKPPAGATLILEATSFPGNTKLYKLVAKIGALISCSPPQSSRWGNPVDEKEVEKWIRGWAQKAHAIQLTQSQCATVVDRVGTEFGLLDCELAKLALFADSQGKVTNDQLHNLVGGWRTQTVWEIAEAVADGRIGVALEQLDKLIISGQNAIGLMAQLSWSLRRFGTAAQLIEQAERTETRITIPQALEQAGFRKSELQRAETQIRRIGRPRAKQMLTWFVELDLKLKGTHSTDHRARFALEELFMRLI